MYLVGSNSQASVYEAVSRDERYPVVCSTGMPSFSALQSPRRIPEDLRPRERIERAGSKTHQPVLCREIIAVCSQIHTKHTNTLWAERRICEMLNWWYI